MSRQRQKNQPWIISTTKQAISIKLNCCNRTPFLCDVYFENDYMAWSSCFFWIVYFCFSVSWANVGQCAFVLFFLFFLFEVSGVSPAISFSCSLIVQKWQKRNWTTLSIWFSVKIRYLEDSIVFLLLLLLFFHKGDTLIQNAQNVQDFYYFYYNY